MIFVFFIGYVHPDQGHIVNQPDLQKNSSNTMAANSCNEKDVIDSKCRALQILTSFMI